MQSRSWMKIDQYYCKVVMFLLCSPIDVSADIMHTLIARFMGPTCPVGPRWAPCRPHDLSYLGIPLVLFGLYKSYQKYINITICHMFLRVIILALWVSNGSGNGLLPVRSQAITWTNAASHIAVPMRKCGRMETWLTATKTQQSHN